MLAARRPDYAEKRARKEVLAGRNQAPRLSALTHQGTNPHDEKNTR